LCRQPDRVQVSPSVRFFSSKSSTPTHSSSSDSDSDSDSDSSSSDSDSESEEAGSNPGPTHKSVSGSSTKTGLKGGLDGGGIFAAAAAGVAAKATKGLTESSSIGSKQLDSGSPSGSKPSSQKLRNHLVPVHSSQPQLPEVRKSTSFATTNYRKFRKSTSFATTNYRKFRKSTSFKTTNNRKYRKCIGFKYHHNHQLDPSGLPGTQVTVPGYRKAPPNHPAVSRLKSAPTLYQLRVARPGQPAYNLEKLFAEFESLHRQTRRHSLSLNPSVPQPRLPSRLSGPDTKRHEFESYLAGMLELASQPVAIHSESSPKQKLPTRQPPSSLTWSRTMLRSLSWTLQNLPRILFSSFPAQNRQELVSQHAPVVMLSEVEALPRSELDPLTSVIIDTHNWSLPTGLPTSAQMLRSQQLHQHRQQSSASPKNRGGLFWRYWRSVCSSSVTIAPCCLMRFLLTLICLLCYWNLSINLKLYWQSNPGSSNNPLLNPSLKIFPKTPEERAEYNKAFHQHSFNAFLSDRLSLQRLSYDNLTASVIICFYNEAKSTLRRTLYSIFNRSPPHLLHEVIVLDDESNNGISSFDVNFISSKIRYLNCANEAGPHQGEKLCGQTGHRRVLIFLDSHIEVNVGWLQPLLHHLSIRSKIGRSSPNVIDEKTFEYSATPHVVGGFTWNLRFAWDPLPASVALRRAVPLARDVRWSSCRPGQHLHAFGAYDNLMETWGGENLEMSFRYWQCGGTVYACPCSRVGHERRPYGEFSGRDSWLFNSVRLANVWLGPFREVFFYQEPRAVGVDPGDLTSRLELQRTLGCVSFKWYLLNVASKKMIRSLPGRFRHLLT
uniref:Glyco_trans_2-like domain-containing protein n=1 Tax=Macrostomum lignano TaxID=282301 RepID=A0A1I8FNE1_9PLAT